MPLQRFVYAFGVVFSTVLSAALPSVGADAIPKGSAGGLALGANWGAYEMYKGDAFRWVANDATIIVNGNGGLVHLTIECSGGPSLGSADFPLRILDPSGRQVDHVMCGGKRHPMLLVLPTVRGRSEFELHVDGGGKHVPGDPRKLNLQVFSLDDGRGMSSPADIADPRSGIRVGAHWNPIEHYGGETFRWMNGNDGEVIVSSSRPAGAVIKMLIEVGPSVGAPSTSLALRSSNGKDLFHQRIAGREQLLIPVTLNPGDNHFILNVASANKPVPQDSRILNARILSLAVQR